MKHSKLLVLLSSLVLVAGLMTISPGSARADTYQRGSTDGHVLRVIAYVLHPVGMVLEYGITRPVHWVVSQPNLDILMGHKAQPGDVFFEWKHGDHTPGIGEVRAQRDQEKMEKANASM